MLGAAGSEMAQWRFLRLCCDSSCEGGEGTAGGHCGRGLVVVTRNSIEFQLYQTCYTRNVRWDLDLNVEI